MLTWLAIAAITNVFGPQLEVVGPAHSVAMSSPDSPSLQAMRRIGRVFDEFDSDSAAMIVLEGEQPSVTMPTDFYDDLVRRLSQDTPHVEHIQDFWGDPLTAGGAQSKDGKAATGPGVSARAIRARRCPTNRSTPSARSSPTRRTARGQGLRHRCCATDHRQLRGRWRQHRACHAHHPWRHCGDVVDRLPLTGHHASGAGDRSGRDCPLPVGSSPSSRTGG